MKLTDTNIRLDRCAPAPFYVPSHLRQAWIDELLDALSVAARDRQTYPFPPIRVCLGDHTFMIIDGWHRVEALRQFHQRYPAADTRGWPPFGTISAEIISGPWQDAIRETPEDIMPDGSTTA